MPVVVGAILQVPVVRERHVTGAPTRAAAAAPADAGDVIAVVGARATEDETGDGRRLAVALDVRDTLAGSNGQRPEGAARPTVQAAADAAVEDLEAVDAVPRVQSDLGWQAFLLVSRSVVELDHAHRRAGAEGPKVLHDGPGDGLVLVARFEAVPEERWVDDGLQLVRGVCVGPAVELQEARVGLDLARVVQVYRSAAPAPLHVRVDTAQGITHVRGKT